MHKLLSRCERVIEWLLALALAVMVLLVFGNVVLRYAFDSGIASAEEVSRLMFVWLVFLGANQFGPDFAWADTDWPGSAPYDQTQMSQAIADARSAAGT